METLNTSQAAAEENGEQVLTELMDALSGAITALVPGATSKSSTETTISNLLNIQSDTELQNIVEQTINNKLVNTVVTEVANTLVGEQLVDLSNIDVSGGVVVSDISQKYLGEQILETVSSVGTGTEIISGIASVSKAEIEKTLSTEQEATKEEIGTFDALGSFADDVISATSGLIGTSALTVLIPILIVGAVLMIVFKPLITSVVASKTGVDMSDIQQATEMYTQPVQSAQAQQFAIPQPEGIEYVATGGAGGLDLVDYSLKVFLYLITQITILFSPFRKLYKKITIFSIVVMLLIAGVLIYLYYLRNKVNNKLKEKYDNLRKKLTDLTLKVGDKFLEEGEDGKICLSDDNRNSIKFNAAILGESEIYFINPGVRSSRYLLTDEDGNVKLEKFDRSKSSHYRFKIEKVSEKLFTLSQKGVPIGGSKCLKLDSGNVHKFSIIS